LLAFGIQAWWEGRQRREAEDEILDQLAEEFVAIQDTLSAVLDEHALHREGVGALLSLADSSGAGSLTAEDFYGAFLGFTSTHLETGTLDGVLASGQLSLITDAELRRMLAAWDSAEEEFAEEWRWVGSQVELLTPFVNGEVDWAAAAVPELMPEIGWAADSVVFESNALPFLRSPRARNFLVERAMSEDLVLREGQRLAELAARIRTRIQAALGSRVDG
jgi:hypothetical protein